MAVWTIIFMMVATVSGIFAFSGISSVFTVPATICFAVFAPLSLIFLVGLKTESRHRMVVHKL
jgi:uncharacterized membrane protein YtjA (UPF0391 family)